jgi:hypothetical protein
MHTFSAKIVRFETLVKVKQKLIFKKPHEKIRVPSRVIAENKMELGSCHPYPTSIPCPTGTGLTNSLVNADVSVAFSRLLS